MFEGLEDIAAGWRSVEHLSAWSGLSIGALAGLGALFYFVPLARKIAIVLAGDVVIAWGCLTYAHSVGVADEDAKLQIISTQDDTRAAERAKTDETARESALEAKAKEQHEEDLAEIARLKGGSADCVFDPGADAGGVSPRSGGAVGAIGNQAKSAASAGAPDKSASRPSFGRFVHLPLVWRSGVQGKGHKGNAAPDSK